MSDDHIEPPRSDPLFDTRSDEELARSVEDLNDEDIAAELVALSDGLSIPHAIERVRDDRIKEAARVVRAWTSA